jgi:hypothetical protein
MDGRRSAVVMVAMTALCAACGSDPSGANNDDPDRVASVSITTGDITITSLQDTVRLTATARTVGGGTPTGTISWSAPDAAIVSVDAQGLVRALSVGTGRVVAALDGKADTVQAIVRQAAATVTVAPSSDSVVMSGTLRLTAQARDRGQSLIGDATFAWTSSNPAIASVDATGLVTGLAVGSVQITARADTASAVAQVKVVRAPLALSADTAISGNVTVGSLTIPRGRTLTATGALVLVADGAVRIDGTLRGDCVSVEVRGRTLDVRGTVNNTCGNPAAAGQPLVLRSTDSWTFDSATVNSSGDILISNVPPPGGRGQAGGGRAGAMQRLFGPPCAASFSTIGNSGIAAAGTDGSTHGGPGTRGAGAAVQCSGNTTIHGVKVYSQAGGPGGTARDAVSALGGTGGAGGDVTLTTGDTMVVVLGAASVLHAQPGGRGGDAYAGPGRDVQAAGGNAGAAGRVIVTAGTFGAGSGGIDVVMNEPVLSANAPDVKRGGKADATGARGADATATEQADSGGTALARGGRGGSLVLDQVVVTGVNGSIVVGPSGEGGGAVVTAGDGGNGNEPFPTGGKGGHMTAFGGTGGDMLSPNGLGESGNGGAIEYHGGHGGLGFIDCLVPWKAGGRGGQGGDAFGQPGQAGQFGVAAAMRARAAQMARGTTGKTTIRNSSVGGDGGAGAGPGPGGGPGRNFIEPLDGELDDDGTSFKPGAPGNACVAQTTATVTPTGGDVSHENFGRYGGPGKNIQMRGGSVIFQGPSPWITVTAPSMDAQGNFVATGVGTYAGFQNIDATMTGRVLFNGSGQITGIDATKVIGANGLLPGGQSITYSVRSP